MGLIEQPSETESDDVTMTDPTGTRRDAPVTSQAAPSCAPGGTERRAATDVVHPSGLAPDERASVPLTHPFDRYPSLSPEQPSEWCVSLWLDGRPSLPILTVLTSLSNLRPKRDRPVNITALMEDTGVMLSQANRSIRWAIHRGYLTRCDPQGPSDFRTVARVCYRMTIPATPEARDSVQTEEMAA